MENRKIVKRTYTLLNGEKCYKSMYATTPREVNGTERFGMNIEEAYLFKKR